MHKMEIALLHGKTSQWQSGWLAGCALLTFERQCRQISLGQLGHVTDDHEIFGAVHFPQVPCTANGAAFEF